MRDALQNPTIFFAFCGVWALVMVAMFVSVTRLCHAVEARSGRPVVRQGPPALAKFYAIAFNVEVAKDDETQRLRWRMIQRQLVILAGFVFFLLVLREAGV